MVGKPRLLSQMHEQISLNTTRFALRESTATVRFWPKATDYDRPLSATIRSFADVRSWVGCLVLVS